MTEDTFDNALKWIIVVIVGAFAAMLLLAVLTTLAALIWLVIR